MVQIVLIIIEAVCRITNISDEEKIERKNMIVRDKNDVGYDNVTN